MLDVTRRVGNDYNRTRCNDDSVRHAVCLAGCSQPGKPTDVIRIIPVYCITVTGMAHVLHYLFRNSSWLATPSYHLPLLPEPGPSMHYTGIISRQLP